MLVSCCSPSNRKKRTAASACANTNKEENSLLKVNIIFARQIRSSLGALSFATTTEVVSWSFLFIYFCFYVFFISTLLLQPRRLCLMIMQLQQWHFANWKQWEKRMRTCFFFISKRPSRGESHWYWSSRLSALSRHTGTDAACKTASVVRRHNLKLLKLQKHFVCVCVIFFLATVARPAVWIWSVVFMKPRSTKWRVFDPVSCVLLDSDSKVWLQASRLYFSGLHWAHISLLFVCLFAFSLLPHLSWVRVSYPPHAPSRCWVQSGNQASIQGTCLHWQLRQWLSSFTWTLAKSCYHRRDKNEIKSRGEISLNIR